MAEHSLNSQPSPDAHPHDKAYEQLRQMELIVSWILRIGVIVSAIVILFGSLLFVITGKSGYASDAHVSQGVSAYTDYQGEKSANLYFPTNPGQVISGALAFKSFALIALGLFLLILTPIFRVAVSVFTFALERDWLYVVFTVIVLAVLLVSFFLGKAGG